MGKELRYGKCKDIFSLHTRKYLLFKFNFGMKSDVYQVF